MRQKKSHSRSAQFDRSERGQSLVELAVSFTLIIFVLAGAVDFGRAYFDVIALRDAAQEGVVYASLNPDQETEIEDRIINSSTRPIDFSYYAAHRDQIDVTWSDSTKKCAGFDDSSGTLEANSVTVTIEYDFQLTMPMISAMFSGGIIPLTIDDTNTILAPQCE